MEKFYFNNKEYNSRTQCIRELNISPNTFAKIKKAKNLSDVDTISFICENNMFQKKRITDEEIDIKGLCDFYKSGGSLENTSKKYNISTYRVQRILRENDIVPSHKVRREYDENLIIDCAKKYNSINQICDATDIPAYLVRKVLTKNNIVVGDKAKQNLFYDTIKKATRKKNYSVEELAKQLNCSDRTVREYIRKYNFKTHKDYLREDILRLHKSGVGATAIAKRLNCSFRKVVKVLNEETK